MIFLGLFAASAIAYQVLPAWLFWPTLALYLAGVMSRILILILVFFKDTVKLGIDTFGSANDDMADRKRWEEYKKHLSE